MNLMDIYNEKILMSTICRINGGSSNQLLITTMFGSYVFTREVVFKLENGKLKQLNIVLPDGLKNNIIRLEEEAKTEDCLHSDIFIQELEIRPIYNIHDLSRTSICADIVKED